MFDLASCRESARAGDLQGWVLRYLESGYWANKGLRDGLLLHPRFWIGPLSLPLARLERCCGPEPDMIWRIPVADWHARIDTMAAGLVDPESLPPLIVEWRDGRLVVCDGSHRHAAMTLKGWPSCFVVIWCNSTGDYERALAATGG